MAQTEAQKRAQAKYRATKEKDNIRQVKFVLRYATDMDIIEYIEKKDNIAGYLKDLIRADIAKEKA